MTGAPRTDPAPALAAGAGSRRPRVLATIAVGLVVAAVVRGVLLESYVVPSAAFEPTFEPGDRVLVLKTDRSAEAGDVALVEDDGGALRLVPSGEATGDVVGTVLWRYWPLARVGPVAMGSAA